MKKQRKALIRLGIFIIVLLVILYFAINVVKIIKLNAEEYDLKMEQERLNRQKENLELQLDSLETEEYIESLARKDLRLVKSNELLYILPDEDEKETSKDK